MDWYIYNICAALNMCVFVLMATRTPIVYVPQKFAARSHFAARHRSHQVRRLLLPGSARLSFTTCGRTRPNASKEFNTALWLSFTMSSFFSPLAYKRVIKHREERITKTTTTTRNQRNDFEVSYIMFLPLRLSPLF